MFMKYSFLEKSNLKKMFSDNEKNTQPAES